MDTKSKKKIYNVALLLLTFVITGCFPSIVKKPDIDQVKKVAILSLYADEKVPNDKGMGVVTDWDGKIRLQVAEDALRTYQAELAKLNWQVVSPTRILQSKEYQQAFAVVPANKANTMAGKFGNFLKNVYQQQFFTPAGMLPIPLDDSAANTRYYGDAAKDNPRARLGEMARRLGVDAVVLIQLDYCYGGGTFSLLGTGQAVMSAGSSIKAVNRNGDMVVNMPAVARCDGKRGESKTSAIMVNGNLQFTRSAKDRFRNMFIEATRASAAVTVEEVRKAMLK
ncbi:MAG TPA: hypothetical protein VF268_08365 [Gammaproteobacteria bacterium]|jgi:hypothetical protein